MPKDDFIEDVKMALRPVEQEQNADVILYVGSIYPASDEHVLYYCKRFKKRQNVLLILATLGGLPDTAYRIARSLRRAYKGGKVTIFVHSICKSAGTLITLGADELIMSDGAHLGPLDIQIQSRDEVGEASSGLTQTQALSTLEAETWRLFNSHFAKLRFGSKYRFSTKMAAQISARITVGMFRPIYEQIDPLRLGENDRAMHIASEYGERLNKESKILKDRMLAKLIDGYPSHSFVIDREEASTISSKIECWPSSSTDILRILLLSTVKRRVPFLSESENLTQKNWRWHPPSASSYLKTNQTMKSYHRPSFGPFPTLFRNMSSVY